MKKDVDFIKTSDINLASTLYTIGFGIDGINPVGNTSKMEFYFKKDDDVDRAISDFWSGRLRVEPNQLLRNRREIISRLKHEQKSA